MPDREKVMRALEMHSKIWKSTSLSYNCEDEVGIRCLYDGCRPGCTGSLASDALALLREQEPRILSLGEAIEGKNGLEIDPYVFVEIKGREDIFIGSVSDISHYNYPDLSFRVGESFQINRNFSGKIHLYADYMKTVRCWTHKPSKEQRKAVEWDD